MKEIEEKANFITSGKYLNIKDLLLIFVVFLLSNIIPPFVFEKIVGGESGVSKGLIMTLNYILSYGVVLLFMFRYRRKRSQNDGYKRVKSIFYVKNPSPSIMLIGLFLVLVAQFLAQPFSWIVPESYAEYVKMIDSLGGYTILLTVLLAPLFEEVLFRGIILQDISRSHGAIVALLVSSLFFALVHLNLVQMVPAFLSALVLGYVYISSQSIRAVVFIHFVSNALSYLILNLFPSFTPENMLLWCKDNTYTYAAIYMVALIIFALMLFRIVKCCRKYDLMTGFRQKSTNI